MKRHLLGLAISTTLLRPGFFAQNLGGAYKADLRERHEIYLPAGQGRVAFVDVRDIGEVAARSFVEPALRRAAFTLTGGAARTFDDVAGSYSVGISCGAVKVPTEGGAKCCWEMDGTCEVNQEFSNAPREACAVALADGADPFVPKGCDKAGDAAPVPEFPVTSRDFLYTPAPTSELLCDLGGGISEVFACVPLLSAEEECSDLVIDMDNLMLGATAAISCDGSWSAGIVCGPVRTEFGAGPACCWGIDGHGPVPELP